MDKINLGSTIPAYPMPVSLVGAYVDGKPNFMAVAWFTMASYKPPRLPLPSGKAITQILELERIKPSAFACPRRIWWKLLIIAELYRVKNR